MVGVANFGPVRLKQVGVGVHCKETDWIQKRVKIASWGFKIGGWDQNRRLGSKSQVRVKITSRGQNRRLGSK